MSKTSAKANSFAALANGVSIDYGTEVTDPSEFLARAEASLQDGKLVLPDGVVPSITRKGDLVIVGQSSCFVNLIRVTDGKYDGRYGTLNILKFQDGTHRVNIRVRKS